MLDIGKAGAAERPARRRQIGNQRRQGDVERQAAESGFGQRRHRQRDDLAGRRRAVTADQFDADLDAFAFGADLAAAHAQHRAGIAQPQRPRRAGEAGDGDAPDLAGHIRPQRQRVLADRVGKPKQFAPRRAAQPAAERFFIFDQRRLDTFIAVRGKACRQPAHQRRCRFRLRWQTVAQTFGKETGRDHASTARIMRTPMP